MSDEETHDDYSLDEFDDGRELNFLTDDDGIGEFLRDWKPTGVRISPSKFNRLEAEESGYTGVRWFNK